MGRHLELQVCSSTGTPEETGHVDSLSKETMAQRLAVDSMIALSRDDCDRRDGWEEDADKWVGSYLTNP